MPHDYQRNGTTTLFAALDILTGTVIGECLPRHPVLVRGGRVRDRGSHDIGVNAALPPGGQIAGKVTKAGGVGLATIDVCHGR